MKLLFYFSIHVSEDNIVTLQHSSIHIYIYEKPAYTNKSQPSFNHNKYIVFRNVHSSALFLFCPLYISSIDLPSFQLVLFCILWSVAQTENCDRWTLRLYMNYMLLAVRECITINYYQITTDEK